MNTTADAYKVSSKENGHNFFHVNIGMEPSDDLECTSQHQHQHSHSHSHSHEIKRKTSFWTILRREIKPLLAESQARRVLWMLALNFSSCLLLFSWCSSTRSIALQAYSYTVWFNCFSLLTSLLSVWVSQQRPSSNFTLGYERCEVLAVFSSTVLAQLAALMVAKESIERLFDQPEIHTGRLLVGAGVALGSHLVVLYGSTNRALEHVMSAATSSWLQEHVTDISQSLCSIVPPLRTLLLPRINPMLLVAATGAVNIFITNLLIEMRNHHTMDTMASIVIVIVICATMLPMSVYSGKVLLQTTPSHIVGQLDKCLRETLTIDGVLEFRNEHFWTLAFGKLAGSLHVRVRRDADEQLVLAHVVAKLSPLVPVLRVQLVKDEWPHSSSLFSSPLSSSFPPSTFSPLQPSLQSNSNLLISGVSSLDPDRFPYKPR